MDDKTLLELAAKAAGYAGQWDAEWYRMSSGRTKWNPLQDDGDALRLAVKLRIGLTFNEMDVLAWPSDGQEGRAEPINVDAPYAAARRVIVLAAADLARGDR